MGVNLKKKRQRKILSLLLMFIMTLTLFSGLTMMAEASTNTVLKINYNNETKTITNEQWETLTTGESAVTAKYSMLTQKPEATPTVSEETGVKLSAILSAVSVDIDKLSDDQNITFTSIDGATKTVTKSVVFSDRYVFEKTVSDEFVKGDKVSPIITKAGRLMIGQTAVDDQNAQYCWSGLFSCQKDAGGNFTSFIDSDYTANAANTAIAIDSNEGESGTKTVMQISYDGTTYVLDETKWKNLKESKLKTNLTYTSRAQGKAYVNTGEQGIALVDILEALKIDSTDLPSNEDVTIKSTDGWTKVITAGDLFATRYAYGYEGIPDGDTGQVTKLSESSKTEVPTIITLTGRLICGQKDIGEYQKQYWGQNLFSCQDDGSFSESDFVTNSNVIAFALPAAPAESTGYASGDGTKDNPYIITEAVHLNYLSTQVNSGTDYDGVYFKLSTDIDLNNETFTPIGGGTKLEDGTATYKFKGIFDGNSKKITNLKVETTTGYTGLFGYNEGTISNMTVEGAVTCTSTTTSSTATSDFVGSIVGFNAGTIKGVVSKVALTAPYSGNVGGIAGFNTSGKWRDATSGKDIDRTIEGATGLITECGNQGNIKSYYKVGGIVGENEGYVKSCYNKGDIYVSYTGSGNGQAGIAGRTGCNGAEWGVGHISNCYNAGSINTKALESEKNGEPYFDARWISGITGFTSKTSTVTNCYTVGTMYKGYDDYAPIAPRGDSEKTLVNNYSLDTIITVITGDSTRNGIRKTSEQMKSDVFVGELGGAFAKDNNNNNNGYPVLKWEQGTNVTVASLEVDTTGAKTDYVEEEKFSVDGIKFYAVYNDGTKELINTSNYVVSKTDALTMDDNDSTVTVKCSAYGFSASKELKIKVKGKVLNSIVVSTAPTKHTYKSGEQFDPAGMRIKASFTNASDKTLSAGFDVDNPQAVLNEESNTITVSYTLNGVTRDDTFDVVVVSEGNAPETDTEGTYVIEDADDMVWFAKNVSFLGKTTINARLSEDIDLSSREDFIPIGTNTSKTVTTNNGGSLSYKWANYYTGTFDGNKKTVTLALEGTSYVALFGYTNGAVIKDITTAGTVKGTSYISGIVAYNGTTAATISGCNNKAEIAMADGASSQNNVAGIMGYGGAGEIENCVNTGKIFGNGARVGGILGYGAVSVSNSTNKGDITAAGTYVGGVVGGNSKAITNCGNEGFVQNNSYNTGGIIGFAGASAVIKGCYNVGSIEGSYGVGGINGGGYAATIEDCYNKGNVKGSAATEIQGVGGIVGTKGTKYSLNLINCYNCGTISTGDDDLSVKTTTGELVGFAAGTASKFTTITNSYYLAGENKVSIGSTSEAAANYNTDNSTSKTLKELSNIASVLGDAYKNSCGGAVLARQAAVDHQYGGWSEDTATFTVPGTQTRTCSVCESTESRNTEATGVGITKEAINNIGAVEFNNSSKTAIDTARAYYDDLTQAQKAEIVNYNVLTAAESKYAELKAAADKAETDKVAADGVIEKIKAIGTVTLESKAKIDIARAGYNALTNDQKALVADDLKTLADAEADYKRLKDAADKEEADTAAASAVTALIGNINDPVTLADKTAVENADTAYAALTADQKAKVSAANEKKLTNAVAKMKELMVPIKDVEKLIDDIPAVNEITGTDQNMADIVAANNSYNSLSDAEKSVLSASHKTNLQAAKNKIAAINHTSNGVTIEGLPWDVRVAAEPTNEGEAYDAMKNSNKAKTLLGMYNITLEQFNGGGWEAYTGLDSSVTVKITNDAFKGYYKAVAIHQLEVGDDISESKHEEIDATISGNQVAFKASGFSNYGIAAEKAPVTATATKTGDDFNLLPLLIIMLIAAAGVGAVVVRRKKKVQ